MQAGLNEIPSILRDRMTATRRWWRWSRIFSGRISTPSRRPKGISGLLTDFGLTHEALGYAVSKSRSHIGNTVRLLRLPEPVLRDVRSGALSSGHARALINAPNPEALAEQILKRGMSVRQTEILVNKAVAPVAHPVRSRRRSWILPIWNAGSATPSAVAWRSPLHARAAVRSASSSAILTNSKN